MSDILAQSPREEITAHIDAIQPPAPAAHTPTLAEIDAQNRAHDDARDAVSQALAGASASTATISADGLPPLPPMPDFSTLPPLPPEMAPPSPSPLDSAAPAAQPATDPSQFRIPGQ